MSLKKSEKIVLCFVLCACFLAHPQSFYHPLAAQPITPPCDLFYPEFFLEPFIVPIALDNVKWISGGPYLYTFPEKITSFFIHLFECIAHSIKHITLNKNDLFHGHVLRTHDGNIVIIFHAKEYPDDLAPWRMHKNGYTTQSTVYRERNFLYSLRENKLWLIKAETTSPDYLLFTQLIIPRDFRENEERALAQRCFTVQADCFGTALFDINYVVGYPLVVAAFHKAF